ATENLPSGTAVKPGDVVKSHRGKTIEIINTDAEGRLILCDALSYARRVKPAAATDAATRTGAVVVALGHVAIGQMGNDETLLAEVREAGERAGERCWPLPLWDEYRELLKSDIADVKNSGGRGAVSIAGGWFLREFVDGCARVLICTAGTASAGVRRPAPRRPHAARHALFLSHRLPGLHERPDPERPAGARPGRVRGAGRVLRPGGIRDVRRARAGRRRDLLGRRAVPPAGPRLGLRRSGPHPARAARAGDGLGPPAPAAGVPVRRRPWSHLPPGDVPLPPGAAAQPG